MDLSKATDAEVEPLKEHMALAEQYLCPCLCDKWKSKMIRADAVQIYPSVVKKCAH